MEKSRLLHQINKISKMGHNELDDKTMAISMSDIDQKAKNFLNRAIDIRREDLNKDTSVLVISSEIDLNEI